MVKKDLRDLKKFKGNDYGADFVLFPVDRKKTVEDIPNLEPHEVNVCAWIGDKNVTGNRKRLVKLIRVDKLVPPPQGEQLYKLLEDKKKEVRSKKSSETLGVEKLEKTVSDLIELYISKVVPSLNDSENYERYLRNIWEPAIGDKYLSEVTVEDLEEVRYQLEQKGLSISSCNARTQAIKSAFRYGSGTDKKFKLKPAWIKNDVSKAIKAENPNNQKERYLSPDELKRLREEIAKSPSENLSDFFEFKLAVGCRWSEVMGLTWDNIDFNEKVITFNKILKRSKCSGQEVDKVTGKVVLIHEKNVLRSGLKNGENSRIMDMENYPEVLESLKERKKEQMKNNIYSDRVFTSNPRKAFEKALKRADIKNFSFHTVRHTCMSYLAQMSLTPLEIKGHGGHKDIKSVMRYAHLDPQLTKRTSNKLREKLYGNG